MVLIRAAESRDYLRVLSLAREIHRFHQHALPDMFGVDERQLPRAAYERMISSAYSAFLLALDEDDVLGYAAIRLEPASRLDRFAMRLVRLSVRVCPSLAGSLRRPGRREIRGRRSVFIDEVVVTAAARGRGIGSALTQACVAWSLEQGACGIDLQVFDFNYPAIRLYEGLGFDTVRRIMRKSLVDGAVPADPTEESTSGIA